MSQQRVKEFSPLTKLTNKDIWQIILVINFVIFFTIYLFFFKEVNVFFDKLAPTKKDNICKIAIAIIFYSYVIYIMFSSAVFNQLPNKTPPDVDEPNEKNGVIAITLGILIFGTIFLYYLVR